MSLSFFKLANFRPLDAYSHLVPMPWQRLGPTSVSAADSGGNDQPERQTWRSSASNCVMLCMASLGELRSTFFARDHHVVFKRDAEGLPAVMGRTVHWTGFKIGEAHFWKASGVVFLKGQDSPECEQHKAVG